MKKLFLAAALFVGGVLFNNAFADESTDIPMEIVQEGGIGNPLPKSPQNSIVITQNDYELTIPYIGEKLTLQLLDDTGIVRYSVFLPIGTNFAVLPSTLSGSYEIRLVASTYYYYGYIEL